MRQNATQSERRIVSGMMEVGAAWKAALPVERRILSGPKAEQSSSCRPKAAYQAALQRLASWKRALRSRVERRFSSGPAELTRVRDWAGWKPALQLRAGYNPALFLAACFALLCLCLPLRADQGQDVSGLFTTDTRWGFSDGAAVSGFFQVDTRFSGSASDASSGLFTVDTLMASIGTATFAGYVTDTHGASLVGATVSALQNDVVRSQAGTDASGYYQLHSLPAGTYQLRAQKTSYLTTLRYGVNVSPGETQIQHFALEGKPTAPLVQTVTRAAESPALAVVTGPQLKVFVNGAFVANGPFDLSKPTVILTHGWNGDPEAWARDMAANMVAGGVTAANILAWDWHNSAGTGLLLSKALSATPREGAKLGQTLATTLGATYRQAVHFVGSSLGTLVNASAVNYLNEQTGGALDWLPSKTQVTLLDDAAIANVEGTLVQVGYTLIDVEAPYDVGSVFTCGYVSPIPRQQQAWIDNYISLVGFYHPDAVNVWLTKAPAYGDTSDPWSYLESVHGYALRWYGETAATPFEALLGNRYGFERLGSVPPFFNPSPYLTGSLLGQDPQASGELALVPFQSLPEIQDAFTRVKRDLGRFGLQSALNFALGVAQKVGSAALEVAEGFIPHTPPGTPVFTGTAGSTPTYYMENGVLHVPIWSLQMNLQTTPPAPPPHNKKGGGGATNQPAMVWIPVAVPTNAAVFCFDFSLAGDAGEDLLSANIAGTNVFALEGKYMPTNQTLNSGPIDVSRWAGQNVEFFFGLLGGTSTNATVTVGAMRFYQVEPPQLQVEQNGADVILSWPASALNYTLVSVASLTDTNWLAVTNPPVLTGLRQQITNTVNSGSRFYRLRKL